MSSIFDGNQIYKWAKDLFPICRSIAGPGNKKTLDYLRKINKLIEIKHFDSGEQAFDWTIPNEWHINQAWIKDEKGNEIINFKNHNLHVMNYSAPVDKVVSFDELSDKLFSIPEMPNSIPYVTSYYTEDWGFCIQHSKKQRLDKKSKYHVFIDSQFIKGKMHYGECLIKGRSKKEILLSTYICHPSMANNELSGPLVTTALINKISSQNNFFSYRILFLPETIGSIAYLSKFHKKMKSHTHGGFVITCVGDEGKFSYIPSRLGNTISDRAALHVLSNQKEDFQKYTWSDRGSDERQYCAPGIDLPIASVTRSKYGEYNEYHTSDDNLNFISPKGLQGSAELLYKITSVIEKNCKPKTQFLCEPMLGKRGLYPSQSTLDTQQAVQDILDIISYSDGSKDLIEIAQLINKPVWEIYDMIDQLIQKDVLQVENE